MNLREEAHLTSLLEAAQQLLDSKYRRGNAEHGGDLLQMSAMELVDSAIEEISDEYFYLGTAKQKIIEMETEISDLNRLILEKDRQIEVLAAENRALLGDKDQA